MTHIGSTLLGKGLAVVGVVGTVAALIGFVGAGTSSAQGESLTLNYTCQFPVIGAQELTVKIDIGLPDTVVAGQTTPAVIIDSDVTVPATAVQGLSLVGAATVQGTAAANATVAAPGISGLAVSPSLAIPSTKVPASGTMDVRATGSAPGLDFPSPGAGSITIGDFSTTLDPKTSTGSDTALGTFTSPCAQDAGQHNLVNFTIAPSGTVPTTTPPATTVPPTTQPTTTVPPTTVPPTTVPVTTVPVSTAPAGTTPPSSTSGSPTSNATAPFLSPGSNSGGGGSAPGTPNPVGLAYTGVSVAGPLAAGALLLIAAAAIAFALRTRRRTR